MQTMTMCDKHECAYPMLLEQREAQMVSHAIHYTIYIIIFIIIVYS